MRSLLFGAPLTPPSPSANRVVSVSGGITSGAVFAKVPLLPHELSLTPPDIAI